MAQSMASSDSKSVLFVCLGNICRSPMAEAVFRSLTKEKKLETVWKVDSAGTEHWNVGNQPDPRTLKTLKKHGINDFKHAARQITENDFSTFDFILGMDKENIKDIKDIMPSRCDAKVCLLGSYDSGNPSQIIEDPYYLSTNELEGFEEVYQQCLRSCTNFLASNS